LDLPDSKKPAEAGVVELDMSISERKKAISFEAFSNDAAPGWHFAVRKTQNPRFWVAIAQQSPIEKFDAVIDNARTRERRYEFGDTREEALTKLLEQIVAACRS
jgi:hypothetical protein